MKASIVNQSAISITRLKAILSYNPEIGIFVWREVPKNKICLIGKIAGSLKKDGYRVITIDRVQYHEHRLAWLYTYGSWPNDQLDHIDRDRTNNKVSNLREANSSTNQANTITKKSKELPKGVRRYTHHRHKKYCAYIKTKVGNKFLGSFLTMEEAREAYKEAAVRYFGEYARLS